MLEPAVGVSTIPAVTQSAPGLLMVAVNVSVAAGSTVLSYTCICVLSKPDPTVTLLTAVYVASADTMLLRRGLTPTTCTEPLIEDVRVTSVDVLALPPEQAPPSPLVLCPVGSSIDPTPE